MISKQNCRAVTSPKNNRTNLFFYPDSLDILELEFQFQVSSISGLSGKRNKFVHSLLGEVTGKSLSEALPFAEHGENMLCTKIVLNVRNNFYTQHVLPRFELGIFMH